MKKIAKNIAILFMAFFVLFISIGLNISKIKCGENSNVYIGIENLTCMKAKESCTVDDLIESSSCCIKTKQINCCCDDQIKMCNKENILIQYDFQTIITETKSIIHNIFIQNIIYGVENIIVSNKIIYSINKHPPPLLVSDLRIKIQSFLI